jgi:hypothetical protein
MHPTLAIDKRARIGETRSLGDRRTAYKEKY